jgi:tetratricopeptide (TPR) repeat protein
MNTHSTRSLGIVSAVVILLGGPTWHLRAQEAGRNGLSIVEGNVQDSQNSPVVAVLVSLEATDSGRTLTSTTNVQGHFRFEGVAPGNYALHAKFTGFQGCTEGPFLLHDHETKSCTLWLKKNQPSAIGSDASGIAFSDEPSFTVAGVIDTTALGGHGSGPIVRNSNALSKETASLAREGGTSATAPASTLGHDASAQEATLRAALAREDNSDLRSQLAEIEEAEGRPLEAVHDYQRAAEMQPTEAHLFAWGAELLLHHAPEPAIEVFTKGHRLYPQSSRMMLGLGAAWYAERAREQAEQLFLQACDVNPADPTPYLFLGRLQATEQVIPAAWAGKMKRFVSLQPENAVAHYLYAVALIKQGEHPNNPTKAEAELNTAIKLDPHLGDAYLQLGILCAEREDFPAAIAALEKAVENTLQPVDAHYRLAQVYRRMGDSEKANREVAEYKKLSEQNDEQADRERHEIPQFVYTLRGQNSSPQPPSPKPN